MRRWHGMQWLCGLVLLGLFGCASSEAPPAQAPFSHELYDGKPMVSLSNDFPPASAAEALARGDQAYRKGDPDLAIYEYLRGLTLPDAAPLTGTFYFKVGYIHQHKGNLSLAQQAYERAVAADPKQAIFSAALGEVLLKQGARKPARQQLLLAAQADQRRQGWTGSQLDLTQLQLDASSPLRAYLCLGILADLQGDGTLARRLYQQVLAKQPGYPLAYLNLGYSLYLSGDLAGAEQQTSRALSLDKHLTRGWSNLGLILVRGGRYEEALEVFSHIMPLHEAMNDTGYLALLNGEPKVAAYYLQQAIDTCPTYYEKAQRNLKRARQGVSTRQLVLADTESTMEVQPALSQ